MEREHLGKSGSVQRFSLRRRSGVTFHWNMPNVRIALPISGLPHHLYAEALNCAHISRLET
jgi:hypothetical protein